MNELDYKELGSNIRQVYLDSDKYQLDKHVPVFKKDNEYVGDFFSLTMFELDGQNPPIFYHTYSPYDTISGKSSDHAVIFRSGQIIMSTEFTPYMRQRTGVMTSVVLTGLGVEDISSKKVLYIGTGNIAQRDLAALKAYYSDLENVSYFNRSGQANAFTEFAASIGVNAEQTTLEHIGEFDVIICHTNSKDPVLTTPMKKDIKQGAIITVFSSENFTEVASDFFNTQDATVLIDWAQTIDESPDLHVAVEQGVAEATKIVTLKSFFTEGVQDSGRYTIYRSHGTPMQNLAALQLLLKQQG